MTDHENELEKIESRLISLETRLTRLESAFVIPESGKVNNSEEKVKIPEFSLNSEKTMTKRKASNHKLDNLAWHG